METVTLKATRRTENGKGPSRRLRAKGRVPAVSYGSGDTTEAVSVEAIALREILLSERGRNSLISLDIDGGATTTVMVRDYVVHPLSRKLLHADFMRLDEKSRVIVEVPFRTTGRSVGETFGGTLLATVHTLKMRCMPSAIPRELTYEVTAMEINDIVRCKDLELPEGVELLMPADRKLLTVAPPRVEAEPDQDEVEGEAAEGEAPEGDAPAGDAPAS